MTDPEYDFGPPAPVTVPRTCALDRTLVDAMALAITESCATSSPILYINDEGGPGINLDELVRAVKRQPL
jgi:hypothetical protein